MAKSILYRLFKLGMIPKELRAVLESEGIIVYDEGIRGRFITKDFKAPGKRFKYRRVGFAGFLVITRKRMIAYAFSRRVINIPFENSKISAITAELVNPNRINFSFNSSEFRKDWKGTIDLQFDTARAQEFYSTIMDLSDIKM